MLRHLTPRKNYLILRIYVEIYEELICEKSANVFEQMSRIRCEENLYNSQHFHILDGGI